MTARRPYPAYKDSGIAWLGKIPAHWDVRRFKTVIASSVNGVWGDDSQGNDNDLVCIRVADFDYANLKVSPNNLTIRNIDPKQRRARLLHQGDLLIEKSGGGDIWPVGRVVSYQLDANAVCSNFIAKLKLRATAENRFMAYLFHAAYAVALNTRSIKQTTGIQNIDLSSYLNEVFALPPLPEQRAIAAFLDRETTRIDALIAKKQRLIELLQEKRTALISRAVTKGLDPDAPMKDSGVEWIGEIPVGWETRRLKYVCDFLDSRRIPISAEIRGSMEKLYPYYGASGIIDYVDDYLFDEPLILVAEDGANLLSRSTPLAFLATGKYWVNNHAHILKPHDDEIDFWTSVLSTVVYDPWVTGAAQPKLTKDNLGSISLPYPLKRERRLISIFLDSETSRIDGLITKIETAIEKLREYRTALISAAVTGKIDVRGVGLTHSPQPTSITAGIPSDAPSRPDQVPARNASAQPGHTFPK